jgi:tetratricopeptide (TPR) repeat protein
VVSNGDGATGSIGRVTAILAAALALLGAIVGNLQLDVSAEGADAARQTGQLDNRSSGARVRTQADVEYQQELRAIVAEYDRRRVLAASRARVVTNADERRRLDAEAVIWDDAAESVGRLSPVVAELRESKQKDIAGTVERDALDRYIARRDAAGDRRELEREAVSERSGDLGKKGGTYVALFAIIAVALFLVGLSLTLPAAHRPWVLGVAALLFGVSVIWTVTTAVRGVASTPATAIEHAVRADVLLGEGRPKAAERELDHAIAARHDYGEALARRWRARRDQAVATRGGRTVSVAVVRDRPLLRAATIDAQGALAAGYSKADVPLGLGVAYALDGEYDAALVVNEQAIERNPDEPTAWLNQGIYAAAVGDADRARRSIDGGIRRLRAPRYRSVVADSLAAARTELERMADQLPERRRLAERLAGTLARATISARRGGREVAPVRPGSVRILKKRPDFLDLPEGFLVDSGKVLGLFQAGAPPKTPFLTTWSVRDGPRSPWIEVPDQAGIHVASKFAFKHPAGAKSGVLALPIFDPGPCAGRREYRLDVWASNLRVASLVAKDPYDDKHKKLLHVGELIGDADVVTDDVLGLQVCRPNGWKVERPDEGVIRVERPDGRVSVEMESVPVGETPESQRDAAELRGLDRLTAEVEAELGRPVPVEGITPGLPTAVGGQEGHASFYTAGTGRNTRLIVIGTSMGSDGVLRSVRAEARLGEGTGASLVAEFITTIRFVPGPAL